MSARRRLFVLVAAACAPEVPERPDWAHDVQPIVAANCVRCHAAPAIGGAPGGFRLDVYADGPVDAAGRVVRGAASMAEFVATRAGDRDEMPPAGPRLSDAQREILRRWARAPALGDRPGNRSPTVAVAAPASADGTAELDVVVHDPDGDLVVGALRTGDGRVVVDDVGNGRRRLAWDTGALGPGPHALVATVTDGLSAPVTAEVAVVNVSHADGNTAPSVAIRFPAEDDVVTDAEASFAVRVAVTDPDPADALTLDLAAVRGATVLPIAESVPVDATGEVVVPWDVALVPAATSWRLRARASDGRASRTAVTGPFIVGRTSTEVRYAAVRPLLVARCASCHPARVAGPDLASYDDAVALRGAIFRRVVQQRDMPPRSADHLFPDEPPLGDDERRLLGDWILGGARP